MGLFKKIISIFQGESEEDEKEDFSSVSELEEATAIKKKAKEEAAVIKKKAEKEAATKKKAEEETAAKKKAEEEAAAKKKAEEEAAANPSLLDWRFAKQLTNGGKNKKIVLPASVCEIAPDAFSSNETLECVDMSSCNKLTKIGECAFKACGNLKNIVFPENIEEIGVLAFDSCKALTSIDLSNCNKLGKIEASAFNSCSSLEEILLPTSLSFIGEAAFACCEALTSIDLSSCNKLGKIEGSAFKCCSSLEEILLPTSLSFIGESAFHGCDSLNEIVCPIHLKRIGAYAFSECKSLRRIELPDSVEVLGENIFDECTLKSLSLPKLIKKLPPLGSHIKSLDMSRCRKLKVLTNFLDCSNETIVFPMGVEEIDREVFKCCDNLKSIYLPPTIKEVELASSIDNIDIYCYAPELETVKDIIEDCACLYVLPQYYDSYYNQGVAEDAEGYLDKIPDDKLYFYDE